jgi:glucokinase
LALDQQAATAAHEHPDSLLARVAENRKRVRSSDVFEAAALGDTVATEILDRAVEFIAMGIVNVTALLDPDAIVFGGGMSSQGPRLLEPLRKKAGDYGLPVPPLRTSSLGEDAQIYGAVYSALEFLKISE